MALLARCLFALVYEPPKGAGFPETLVFCAAAHAGAEQEILERVCVQHALHDDLILLHSEVDAVILGAVAVYLAPVALDNTVLAILAIQAAFVYFQPFDERQLIEGGDG